MDDIGNIHVTYARSARLKLRSGRPLFAGTRESGRLTFWLRFDQRRFGKESNGSAWSGRGCECVVLSPRGVRRPRLAGRGSQGRGRRGDADGLTCRDQARVRLFRFPESHERTTDKLIALIERTTRSE